MGKIFFDESIHDNFGFILWSFVFIEDWNNVILDDLKLILDRYWVLEFKSSFPMAVLENQYLRDEIQNKILPNFKLWIVITPNKREILAKESLSLLYQIIVSNKLEIDNLGVYYDEWVKIPQNDILWFYKKLGQKGCVQFHFNQKSHEVLWIQIADLSSNLCSQMLKAKYGKIKTIKVWKERGYNEVTEVPLDWEIFRQLRWNFFSKQRYVAADYLSWLIDLESMSTYEVQDYWLYVSDSCSEELYNHSINVFWKMYLWCTL